MLIISKISLKNGLMFTVQGSATAKFHKIIKNRKFSSGSEVDPTNDDG